MPVFKGSAWYKSELAQVWFMKQIACQLSPFLPHTHRYLRESSRTLSYLGEARMAQSDIERSKACSYSLPRSALLMLP